MKLCILLDNVVLSTKDSVPERSKGSDSRSLALCFVGSNPTAINIIIYLKFTSLNGKAISFKGIVLLFETGGEWCGLPKGPVVGSVV